MSLASWSQLGISVFQVPALVLHALSAMNERINASVEGISALWILLILFCEILIFSFCVSLKRVLKRVVDHLKESPGLLANKILYVITELFERNVHGIFIFSGMTFFLIACDISLKSFSLIYGLLFVVYGFKGFIDIARISLLETINAETDGHDVKLYYRLKWILILGGVLTTFVMLGNQLPIAYEVQDTFNRLFMVFLLAIALQLLSRWKVIPNLLCPYIHDKRPYLEKASSFCVC